MSRKVSPCYVEQIERFGDGGSSFRVSTEFVENLRAEDTPAAHDVPEKVSA